MKLQKKGKFNIAGVILGIVGAVLTFSVLQNLIPTFADAVYNVFGTVAGNTTLYGAGPAAIATVMQSNWAYFVIVTLVLMLIGYASFRR